jgi:hypothetical protein
MTPVQTQLLEPIPPIGKSPVFTLWIKRTPSLFRGVLELDCSHKSIEESVTAVHNAVTAEYAPDLFVPFTFVAILRYSDESPTISEYLVDDHARSRATWQWIVVVNASTYSAYGCSQR